MSRKTRQKSAGPFCAFPPNARFNFMPANVDAGWISITLRPGQSIEYVTGGPTDEGFSWTAERWTYDADEMVVSYSYANRSRDCDGPLDRYSDSECLLIDLHALPAEPADPEYHWPELPARPAWSEPNRSQRDHFAEAAGY